MQNAFSVHFVVRSDRVDEDDYVPIYAAITLNGKKLRLSTNQRVRSKDWNSKKGVVVPKAKDATTITAVLEALQARIHKAYAKLLSSNAGLDIDALKSEISGRSGEAKKEHCLIETTIEHNDVFQKLVGVKYSEGSMKNYRTSLRYYKDFVPLCYKKKDIPLSLVNYKFCEAFFIWLTTEKDCKVNGANKHIQRLRKIINYAMDNGYVDINPMRGYKLSNTPVNKQALTMEELKRIEALELQRPTLRLVRNIFVIQAYTGLAYSDIKRLTVSMIQLDGNGDYWIRMDRQKTMIAFSVPLLPTPLVFLGEYLGNALPDKPFLPVLTNQKMNENLKIVQELAGVSKSLTTHLARHTFACTITLANGVPIETVSRMLGHTKLSTTQVYARVLEGKIAEDMKRLKARLSRESSNSG